jgi:prophage regulatory protein
MANQGAQPARLIRGREVEARVGLRTTAIREKVKRGEFPAPVQLGAGPTSPNAWLEEDIDRWIGERVEASRKESAA